jgi:hypothetical protein
MGVAYGFNPLRPQHNHVGILHRMYNILKFLPTSVNQSLQYPCSYPNQCTDGLTHSAPYDSSGKKLLDVRTYSEILQTCVISKLIRRAARNV